VLDYNGTIAVDGMLLPGTRRRLAALARELRIHVLTADTFGNARDQLRDIQCKLIVLRRRAQGRAKADYVIRLGAARAVCIGNGRNDRLMLKAAALGIAVLQAEGAATQSVRVADIAVRDAREALDLLLKPRRLVATLRD